MSHAAREVELKLEIDPTDVRRLKRHLGRLCVQNGVTRVALVSVYFDTAELALRERGLSLRVRRIGRRHVQTIKRADGFNVGLFDRAEWEHDIRGARPDLAMARGTGLEPLRKLAKSLRPVFETRIRRTEYRLANHGVEVAVMLDQGSVDTGKRQAPVCEVELELVRGDVVRLFALARALGDVVPMRLCVNGKADRGYALLLNEAGGVETATDVHLSPDMSAAGAFRVIARSCLRQLAANEPGMLADNGEALHQMRIALRRLRAAISLFSEIVADRHSERLKAELRWITAALGPARDLDVFVAEVLAPLREQRRAQPGIVAICRDFERQRAMAYAQAAVAVRAPRFRSLVLDAAAWIEAGPWSRNRDDLLRMRRAQPIAQHAADELDRRRGKIRKRGKSLRRLSAAQRHRLRMRAKKLRYAFEFFVELFPRKKSARRCRAALSALKDLQGALGSLNDIAARESLAAHVALSPGGSRRPSSARRAFAAGVIFGAQEAHVDGLLDAAGRAYEKFLAVEPFWK